MLQSNKEVLQSLLSQIEPINFHEVSGTTDDKDVKNKHHIVTTIDELQRMATAFGWGVCMHNESIYIYNGQFWQIIEPAEFKSFLGDVALEMGVDKMESRYYQFRDQLYKQFVSSANLPAPERPKGTVLINLSNGTFEIGPGGPEQRDFSRQDFLTYQLPFEYRAGAPAPLFMEYLNRVLPEPELQNMLAEFIGYVFLKNWKLEKCLLLYGSGANGKSVFMDIINALLGKENVSNFSLGDLSAEHNRALIGNKLLNYGSEIRSSIDSDLLKQMVSGEPVQARLKYKNSISLDNYARLCFNCNELPKDVEQTEAYFRRFLIIPFRVTIPEKDRDPGLAGAIIEDELPGVFNWVLSGLSTLMDRGKFAESDIVKGMVNDFKADSDSVYEFLEDMGYMSSEFQEGLYGEVYAAYGGYCKDSNNRALSRRKFTERIQMHGFGTENKGAGGRLHVYRGKK